MFAEHTAILLHFSYLMLILSTSPDEYNANVIRSPPCSSHRRIIILSSNECCIADNINYNLFPGFPMRLFFSTNISGDAIEEVARQPGAKLNVTRHYFVYLGENQNNGIIQSYVETEELTKNSYKVCGFENSSLSIKSLPWRYITHIYDYNNKVFNNKRHLQSDVERLELRMCTKLFISAPKLVELSYIETSCKDGMPSYEYYPQINCGPKQFHCYSGECIPGEWKFDGEIHCFDGSDERQYEESEIFVYDMHSDGLSIGRESNGTGDCANQSYEGNCTGYDYCTATGKHLCGDGTCISSSLKCTDTSDCNDGSDEDYCFRDKLNATQLKKYLVDYRTLMTTIFSKETQKSIASITTYGSDRYIYSRIDFKHLILRVANFSNLNSLNLSNTIIIPESRFDVSNILLTSMENLYLRHCGIQTFDNIPLQIFPSIKVIDLSHNMITNVNPNLFRHMKYIIDLNMSMNFKLVDINLQFNTIQKTNYIDLSNNKLHDITLNFSKAVKEINLSNNPVKYNSINLFSDLPLGIDKLILHENRIDINMLFIEHMKNVKAIDVQNYTLDCSDCRILESGVFSISHSGVTVIYNGTQHTPICTLPEEYKGRSISEVNVYDYCTNPVVNIAITASVIIGLVVIISVIFGYKYRFEITYWIQYTRLKRRKVLLCQCDTQEYEYDAFISYCGADRRFVWKTLRPALEECPQKFKLCLHERDFLLGTHIFDNIEKSFKTSRYCVMVISNDFVKSQWCRFELESASYKLIQEKREFLILIQLEELDSHDLPRHLKYLIATRTYLEWNVKKFAEEELLQRLRKALGKSLIENQCENRESYLMELKDMQ